MKLILAVIHDEDAQNVMDELNAYDHRVTKLCSTGGFLRSGNTTLMAGVEEAFVDEVINIIENNSKSRKRVAPPPLHNGFLGAAPLEITVGGATLFVLDVERYDKF